ncbi:MarR family winged helix-turn-helix transcriptional regulator [Reichenbachiella ulvae]|uniref:MarR family winged helix-turn-helix transcriptional regulator n=1 Tax=Reichenbachiella ulvae TaxID=2980104 RepID=A0ABT3CX76_9BACT|nr:MarR family winged helix-turn-helix transcriptional regulator [Reichenbachiella ulvae]MCV9388207.1 MarR family winged helix-turn-helix transcriptional regulator [Reichenbachiella ulvae]
MKIEQEIIASIRKIIRAVDIYSNRLKEQIGLNSSQLTCLNYLSQYGPRSISELGKMLNLSPSMLTNIIDQLESRLLVERVRSDKDRRIIKIEMTNMGEEILNNSPMFLHKKLENNLSDLSEDKRKQILDSLSLLITAIEAEDVDSSPILATGENIVGEPEITINKEGEFKPKH